MSWTFSSARRRKAELREAELKAKIDHSQMTLMHAAVTTADAAHSVTSRLKQHLEDSIAQFETTVRLLTDALIVCDAQGYINACNPASEAIFAAPAHELIRLPISRLFQLDGQPPSSHEDVRHAVELGSDGINVSAPLKGIRRNGVVFPVETIMTRLDQSSGKVLYLLSIRDMTHTAALTRVAEQHEQRSRALFNVSFDAILIVQHGRVVAANQPAGKLFGHEPDKLLSTAFTDLVSPESREVVDRIDDEPGTVQVATTRRDGTPMQLLFASTSIIWNDDEASLLTVKDTSEMQRMESSLRHARENGIDMIVCFNAQYQITFANEPYSRYYDRTPEELKGTDVRTLMSEQERSTFLLNVSSLSKSCPSRRVHLQIMGSDGSMVLQDWVDHASYDSRGEVTEFQRSGRDITEVMQAVLKKRVFNV